MSGLTQREVLLDVRDRSQAMFSGSSSIIPPIHPQSVSIKRAAKLKAGYLSAEQSQGHDDTQSSALMLTSASYTDTIPAPMHETSSTNQIAILESKRQKTSPPGVPGALAVVPTARAATIPRPVWHAPWELSKVIAGHMGWVRSIAIDPDNEYFATGSADSTIKIWDLAKCCAGADNGLRLTLTGHIDQVRAIAISARHPYMFSAGDDKTVKCWDLETNTVIRNYHGHHSAVISLALHPTLDILVTGGRDSVARVWDMRTKAEIHVLGGHQDAVSTIATNSVDPQIVTGSMDSTIKLWDLAAGKTITTLTHHKKSVRSILMSRRELTFVSASSDNIKKWQCREGKFLRNFVGHAAVVNSLAMNDDGVLFSGGDDGTMRFWDYETGYCFQAGKTTPQPGSLEAENGIFASAFDQSGSRLITCEADKSIKIWKENEMATEDSHPIDMQAWAKNRALHTKF
jgi:pleiotropic regulator 1